MKLVHTQLILISAMLYKAKKASRNYHDAHIV